MKISTVLKFAQITLIAFAFIFATSYTAIGVQAAGKKPSFAGKPAEKLGKGGRSEEAKQHGKNKVKKEKKKTKKEKKEKKAKKGKKGKKK